MTDMNELPTYRVDFRHIGADASFPVKILSPGELRNGIAVRMPNHLGDAVMALPALKALKEALPADCGLFVIAPRSLRQLYAVLDCVDGIFSLAQAHRLWSLRELRGLHAMRVGAGVLFNNSLRDAVSMRLSGVPRLYGADKRGRAVLLTRAFRFPGRRSGSLAKAHLAQRYLAMAAALGGRNADFSMPRFDLSEPLLSPTDVICALVRHPLHLVLAAGAAYGAAKRWPEENFRVVADYWLRHGGVVSVVGSTAERGVGNLVLKGLPAERSFNLCGKTSLNQLMLLLKGAALCVANDSGVMHLAAAMGRPGVAVFGSTDYSATGPIGANWKILYSGRACSPCFARTCPRNNPECMTDIPAEAAIAALEDLF